MAIFTRFAPSPTGFLHIGSARTALFNYLFAKNKGGKYLLRIEDTDLERSTQVAVDAILRSLKWLELDWDGETVLQSKNLKRHQEIGLDLYSHGKAYYCDCKPEDLEKMREKAKEEGKKPGYNGHCRNRKLTQGALRLLTPEEGRVTVEDLVQGPVTVENSQIDDMVLLRSDGTPTYMLSVVVDDHDMNITHVIRGDDHLTNTFRQYHIYHAMGWDVPQFAHIPMIHGPDGSKLSKRHGAIGVEAYEEMGYLPEALRNYLLRLGWGHGDDEIISDAQAIEWFSLDHVGKSPSRFDYKKLDNLNAHYLRQADNDRLVGLIVPRLEAIGYKLSPLHLGRLKVGMNGLKQRAITVKDLALSAVFYVKDRPLAVSDETRAVLKPTHLELLQKIMPELETENAWTVEGLESLARDFAAREGTKLGEVAQPLRIALTGSSISPSIFEVMEILGKDESMGRLKDFEAV
jgi:glutamyl-tRNA synthetase